MADETTTEKQALAQRRAAEAENAKKAALNAKQAESKADEELQDVEDAVDLNSQDDRKAAGLAPLTFDIKTERQSEEPVAEKVKPKYLVRQFGQENWEETYEKGAGFGYWQVTGVDAKPDGAYLLLTDDYIVWSEQVERLIKMWPSVGILYTGTADARVAELLRLKRATKLKVSGKEAVTKEIQDYFFFGQRGMHTGMKETFVQIPGSFRGTTYRDGRFSATFDGYFGEKMTAIGMWGDNNAHKLEGLVKAYLDFWPGAMAKMFVEGHADPSVEWEVRVQFLVDNELEEHIIPGIGSVFDPIEFRVPKRYQSAQAFLYAKGQGKLTVERLIARRSRSTYGTLLIGDKRQVTSDGQEVLSYYNPGTRLAPLVVSFAGSRLYYDGFELMNTFGYLRVPYILFTDSRTQGGAFHVGTPEYEALVLNAIHEAMADVGVDNQGLILHGFSLGSYPALYYAADLNPRATIVSKPIINLGTFSADVNFPHAGATDWPLDMRRFMMGRMDPADTDRFNNKLWDHLKKGDWPNILVYLFTLQEDEYDGVSLPELWDRLRSMGAHIEHHYEHGKHIEKIGAMLRFISFAMESELDLIRGVE